MQFTTVIIKQERYINDIMRILTRSPAHINKLHGLCSATSQRKFTRTALTSSIHHTVHKTLAALHHRNNPHSSDCCTAPYSPHSSDCFTAPYSPHSSDCFTAPHSLHSSECFTEPYSPHSSDCFTEPYSPHSSDCFTAPYSPHSSCCTTLMSDIAASFSPFFWCALTSFFLHVIHDVLSYSTAQFSTENRKFIIAYNQKINFLNILPQAIYIITHMTPTP